MSKTHVDIKQLIGQAIGEASMCWSETPKGTFDSERAAKICQELAEKLERRVFLESAIQGHMEAMRPLLDEWSGKL